MSAEHRRYATAVKGGCLGATTRMRQVTDGREHWEKKENEGGCHVLRGFETKSKGHKRVTRHKNIQALWKVHHGPEQGPLWWASGWEWRERMDVVELPMGVEDRWVLGQDPIHQATWREVRSGGKGYVVGSGSW